ACGSQSDRPPAAFVRRHRARRLRSRRAHAMAPRSRTSRTPLSMRPLAPALCKGSRDRHRESARCRRTRRRAPRYCPCDLAHAIGNPGPARSRLAATNALRTLVESRMDPVRAFGDEGLLYSLDGVGGLRGNLLHERPAIGRLSPGTAAPASLTLRARP